MGTGARGGRTVRYVRSQHVVCYWEGDGLVLHNYATGARLPATALTCSLADACTYPATLREIAAACPQVDAPAIRALVGALRAKQILYRSSRRLPRAEAAMSAFERWNPAAGLFHTATRDVPFGERREGERRQSERARSWPMPVPVKRYPGRPAVPLPRGVDSGEFPSVLLARRTWRRFSRKPLTIDSLALLLRLTAGIHQWLPARAGGASPLRTSPSGGARHPIEVYLVARHVTGLAAGLYHYSSDRHVLERLRRGVHAGGLQRYLPAQPWYEGAGALVFFSALFERSLWRYDYARAYRAVLIEAGHLCQTFCLTATWLGLAPFCSMALADSVADTDLGLDGISESVLYAAGVGHRGSPAHAAMAPDDVRPLRLRPNRVFL